MVAVERQQAAALWERLERRTTTERRALLEEDPQLHHWALSAMVCDRSLEAAPDCAVRAGELAQLAIRIAELCPCDEDSRWRLLGYAREHLANAHRVSGLLCGAKEEFAHASQLWQRGCAHVLLKRSRLQQLEVSLLITCQRLPEAMDLVDRALSSISAAPETLDLLIQKGRILDCQGSHGAAITLYRQCLSLLLAAAGRPPQAQAAVGPRVHSLAIQNLVMALCGHGQYRQAKRLELDLVRLSWLEGLVAHGLRGFDQAIDCLSQVYEAFTARDMAVDVALVSLDLGEALLARGAAARAKGLAKAAAQTLRDLEIPRTSEYSVRAERMARGLPTVRGARARVENAPPPACSSSSRS